MGMPLCCMNERKEILNKNNENKIKQYLLTTDSDEKISKIIKIQSYSRVFLSKNKLDSLFNSTKTKISNELEEKKLINETRITECESHKIYTKLISEKKILPFSEQLKNNPELNNLYSKISKFSFVIPNYIVTSPNEVYRGSWNINKRYHGHGVKYQFNDKKTTNKRIEGIFLNGFLFGQGIVIFSNGEIVTGNFVKNNLNGAGEHYRKDKSIYRGEFKNGKYNNLGKESFIDGSFFEGFFKDGSKSYGTFEFKNGNKYKGEFLNDVFHGKGVHTWANKKVYDGHWKNGKMNGLGKFTYPDGSFYEGEFLDGKKCGTGKYVWGKDRYYEGKWKNDKQNGQGVYHDKNKIMKGNWINGKLSNTNIDVIKKNNTFYKSSKSRNQTPNKNTFSQENLYYKSRINLTDKKKNSNRLNFNPTVNGKCFKSFFRSHINLHLNKNNQNSLYSIESTNTIKSNNNYGECKTSNNELIN